MSDLWATPKPLFDKLDTEFRFGLDAAALHDNTKCSRFFSPAEDGLVQAWKSEIGCSIWLNPPYGREIGKWMKKAYDASLAGERVVCLVPNRSNAPWWHDYVMKAREIRFIKHKVSFEGEAAGVPFWGSVIVVFGPWASPGAPRVSTYLQPRHEGVA